MIGKNQTMIEEIVTGLKRQELADNIQGYSDYVVEEFNGKSFGDYCDVSLEKIDDNKDLMQFEICNAIKDLIIPEGVAVPDATSEQRAKVVSLSEEILDIITFYKEEDNEDLKDDLEDKEDKEDYE